MASTTAEFLARINGAKATPPHLRKKAGDALAEKFPSQQSGGGIAQHSNKQSTSPELAPETECLKIDLPSSSPPSAEAKELPVLHQAAIDAGASLNPEQVRIGVEDTLTRPTWEASVHAPPAMKEQSLEPSTPSESRSFLRPTPRGKQGTKVDPPARLQQYDPDQLIGIGKQCSNRLPPASAIQAMFLYEMQRETESERLFEGQMFRLAKQEDEILAQARRYADMDARMAKLERQVASNDAMARAATSDVRMDVHHQRLGEQADRLQATEARLSQASEQLEALKQAQRKFTSDTANALREVAHNAVAAARIAATSSAGTTNFGSPDFTIMKQEIDVLFMDRDAILLKLGEVHERIKTLTDSIHQLTIQKTNPNATSPAPAQRLPVSGTHGDLVDVSIPKGRPAVGLNGSRHADAKSFVPGKPWGA